MGSRLFQEIREKRGLAYSVGSYAATYREGGMFVAYGGTSPDTYEQCLDLVRAEFASVREKGITEAELTRAKNQFRGSLVLAQESMSSRMNRLGKSEVYFNRVIPMEEILAAINAVSNEDILRVASQVFPADPGALTIAAIGPIKKARRAAAAARAAAKPPRPRRPPRQRRWPSMAAAGAAGTTGAAAPIRVLVSGARGRMGREVVRAVGGESDMEVVAEVDAGEDLAAALARALPDVMVDFTVPEAALPNLRAALEAGVIPLVGTTGLGPADIDEVRALCARHGTAALIAPNFALGAVLLMRFAAEAARYLPDVEIIELHHEKKARCALRHGRQDRRDDRRGAPGRARRRAPGCIREEPWGARRARRRRHPGPLGTASRLRGLAGGPFWGARPAAVAAPRFDRPHQLHARRPARDPASVLPCGPGLRPRGAVVKAAYVRPAPHRAQDLARVHHPARRARRRGRPGPGRAVGDPGPDHPRIRTHP
jgi:hypothetical protein